MRSKLVRVMSGYTSIPSKLGRYTAIPLRLIAGYGFMAHGYAKVVHGPQHFFEILRAIGVPAPELMGWATILVELVGGFAVLVGAFVPLVSVPMAAVLLVAMFTVHLPYGFSSIKLQSFTAAGAQFGPPGYETGLLYLACLAALVMGGSGPFTLDVVHARGIGIAFVREAIQRVTHVENRRVPPQSADTAATRSPRGFARLLRAKRKGQKELAAIRKQ